MGEHGWAMVVCVGEKGCVYVCGCMVAWVSGYGCG